VGLLNSHAKDLEKLMPGKVMWDRPLARFTTLRVGGPAEAVVTADSAVELARLLQWLRANNIACHVIGNGSNILVPDEGLAGVVVMLGKGMAAIEIVGTKEEKILVQAGAGCRLGRLIASCAEQGISGLEFMVNIPGSVGGAIVMNAGCWGREIGDVLDAVTMLTPAGELLSRPRAELNFSYRQWGGSKDTVIISGIFALAKGDPKEIRATCREYCRKRKGKQPQQMACAGSFFKNPPGQAAGRLIEEAGLKGRRVGGAMVSPLHANFIVNTGTATAADILALAQLVQNAVYDRSGIMLEPEVHILSNNGDL
jgi:UDP-N-acetylmuramate dehydrogenase